MLSQLNNLGIMIMIKNIHGQSKLQTRNKNTCKNILFDGP